MSTDVPAGKFLCRRCNQLLPDPDDSVQLRFAHYAECRKRNK